MELEPKTVAESGLNNYFMRTSLWPAILYTTILMIVGTIGNILVLYVYRRHFQRSVTRMFIYALAILDLGNCLITMPAELSILIQFTSFPSPAWCKLSRYLTYTFNGTSSIVLITIAMDRYLKVCRPMHTYITIRRARIICIASFCLIAVLSIPSLIIYGEMKLPILVTGTEAKILPRAFDLVNSSSLSSTTARSSKHSSESLNQVTLPGGISDARTSYGPNGVGSYMVYGRFCLLSSEHINGKLPLLFYISIFIFYLVMVVLVVFFYGKVARAMFALTSKHSKLFSFYTHKNCTPSSNSVNPECSDVHFQVPGSKIIVNEVSSADIKTKQSSTVLVGHRSIGKEESVMKNSNNRQTKTLNNSQTEKKSEHKGDVVFVREKNARETGYETEDTNSNSEIKAETDNMHNEDTKGIKITDGVHETSPTTNKIPAALLLDSDVHVLKMQERQKDSNLRNLRPQKAHSSNDIAASPKEIEKRRRTTITRKHKEANKIPKIKVQKAETELSDSDHMINNKQCTALEHYPHTTNSLLRRRIQSAENIHHLSGLQMLQVPDGRFRTPWFPDICDAGISRAPLKQASRRDNVAGIGQVTTSCVNLDYTADSTNSATVPEKTLTLTKTSSLGKTMCVLPLRGMTTKTASQAQKRQTVPAIENMPTSHSTPCNQDRNVAISKSDSQLELSQGRRETVNLAVRTTPLNLNSPDDVDSAVTLRHATPKSASLPNDILKQFNFEAAMNTPRRKVPSTADILQEQHRKGSLHPFRMSRMLFVISLVFVISFLPFFIIALMRSGMGLSFLALDEVNLGVVSVFIRSSLLSNAVNPIAYGFLSTHFRRECTGIMCCIFRR